MTGGGVRKVTVPGGRQFHEGDGSQGGGVTPCAPGRALASERRARSDAPHRPDKMRIAAWGEHWVDRVGRGRLTPRHENSFSGRQCWHLITDVALGASGVDWSRWRGPDLNGISKETGWQAQWPAEGPKAALEGIRRHGVRFLLGQRRARLYDGQRQQHRFDLLPGRAHGRESSGSIPILARSTQRTLKAGRARRPRWRMAASIPSAGKGTCSAWTRQRGP